MYREAGNTPRSDPSAERALNIELVGASRLFDRLLDKAMLVAPSRCTILVCGETGTGKSVLARTIHSLSDRAPNPFVTVNCARPVDLIDNELFGHERGAFTGATEARNGLVHLAEQGTLFLDEVDALPPHAQRKLLMLLEEKEYRPLGSRQTRRADVRVIAATNENLLEAVRAGRIRKDFYYRLAAFPLTIPPLRERRADILPLARHFLREDAPGSRLSDCAAVKLLACDWPGNARELKNAVVAASIRARNRAEITGSEIELPPTERPAEESFAEAKTEVIEEFERHYLENILALYRGNVSEAARAAKMSRRTVQRLARKYASEIDRFRDRPR